MNLEEIETACKQMNGEEQKVKIATLTYENQQLRERLDKIESILLKYNMK